MGINYHSLTYLPREMIQCQWKLKKQTYFRKNSYAQLCASKILKLVNTHSIVMYQDQNRPTVNMVHCFGGEMM